MKIIKNVYVSKLTGLLILDCLLFSTTDARNVTSLTLAAGFILLVLTIYHIVRGLLSFVGLYGLSIKRKRTTALYITGAASLMIALQSVGELGSRDFWVLMPLVVLSYLYSAYAKTTKRDLGI